MSSYLGDVEEGPLDIGRSHVRLNGFGAWCAHELTDIDNFTEWVQVRKSWGLIKQVRSRPTIGL